MGYNGAFEGTALIQQSTATGSVSGGSGSSYIGGLVGGNYAEDGKAEILQSTATGNVSGGSGSADIGGLVGENSSSDGLRRDPVERRQRQCLGRQRQLGYRRAGRVQ